MATVVPQARNSWKCNNRASTWEGVVLQMMMRAVRGSLPVACIAAALFIASGCGDSATSSHGDVIDEAAQAVHELGESVDEAESGDDESLIDLRATAEETEIRLSNVLKQLSSVEVDTQSPAETARLEATIRAFRDLAKSLARADLSPRRIEVAAAKAKRLAERFGEPVFEPVDVRDLVLALRGGDALAKSDWTYEPLAGDGFTTRVPTGDGWGEPSRSEPTPGELLRTRIDGPDDMMLLIDYTPLEPARFGQAFRSKSQTTHESFGTIESYLFSGGALPECAQANCVDYIMNSSSGGPGYAVLAAAETKAMARSLARKVALALRPTDAYRDGPPESDGEPDSSECDENYAGACLDPNSHDYDCAGGTGDGPDYTGTVEVIGDDHFGLDRDGNGIGCE